MGTEWSLGQVAQEDSCEPVVCELRPQRREGVKARTTWELREPKGRSLWVGAVLGICKNSKALGLAWSRSAQRPCGVHTVSGTVQNPWGIMSRRRTQCNFVFKKITLLL